MVKFLLKCGYTSSPKEYNQHTSPAGINALSIKIDTGIGSKVLKRQIKIKLIVIDQYAEFKKMMVSPTVMNSFLLKGIYFKRIFMPIITVKKTYIKLHIA